MFFDKVINLIYPKVCGLCGIKINENKTYACEKCFNILKYTLNKAVCKNVHNAYFDKLISLYLYQGVIRNKILEFKFFNKPYIGRMFAELMCYNFSKTHMKVDLIIPVPIHTKRYLERGYNQSEILAKNISKRFKIKFKSNILIKSKNTVAQSSLNLEMRKKNVIDVYKIKCNKEIRNKTILLVDDIYTTGATVNECSKILKENGAKKVIVMTISYGKFDKEEF